MLFSLILLVSCVGSSAHGSAQPDKVVRDVPAPNTGSGSDGRFAKSKLLLMCFISIIYKRYACVVAKWSFLLPVTVVV